MGKGHISGIPPLTLTSSSPWCHQMSPQFGDISEDLVAPLEGHLAGFIAATCVTQHSNPWLLSSQGCRRHWGQCLLKDRRHGIHGQGSHHTEVPLLQTKSQHVQPGPCGVHLPAQEPPRHICSHLSPSWGDLQSSGPPRQQEPWWGGAPQKSADTAAQYLVTLCQEQLPDVNPTWHKRSDCGHTLCPNFRSCLQ